jgi:ribonuclease BN (tRNA processing enzyme)
LVLTHLYPICDDYDILGQCQEAFAEEIIVAGDLISFFL